MARLTHPLLGNFGQVIQPFGSGAHPLAEREKERNLCVSSTNPLGCDGSCHLSVGSRTSGGSEGLISP